MSLRTLALVACGAAALTACASSRDARDTSEPVRALLSADAMMFIAFDTDGDLSTTTAEVEAGIPREFTRADTNGDGSLTPLEFQNWSAAVLGGSQMGPFRLDFDRNVDNTISREEFVNEIRARMRDYDSDENGAMSRSEYVRLVGQARPARAPLRPEGAPPIGR